MKTKKKKVVKKVGKIDKKMTFASVLSVYPESAEVFMDEGMHCAGCPMAAKETIEQGCKAHGIDSDKVIEKLNIMLKKKKK